MFELFLNLFSKNANSNDPSKPHVYVNIYDMIQPNYVTNIGYYTLGVGVFHSGVEIGGKEYCFGGHDMPNVTGVFVVEPRIGIPELTLKQSVDIGSIEMTDKEVEELLLSLSDEYIGTSYNLLTRNCNHFSEEFVNRLSNNKKTVPLWVNRAARLGAMFPCVVPWEWIQPPELAEDEESLIEEEAAAAHSVQQEGSNDENEIAVTRKHRRSSTISLLSSSKRGTSSVTYQSTLH